ncbi:MAG TPA: MscL family protein [Candidatus Saccharimonadales bacterium]|jgi:large conductance mechanosensitive channel protein
MTDKIPSIKTINAATDADAKQTTIRLKPATVAAIQKAVNKQAEKAAQTGKKHHAPAIDIIMDTDDFAREQVHGFFDFLREHAIVGLAVGFIIGAQAQTVVKQLVSSFIDPAINVAIGGAKLSERKFWVGKEHFDWGAMVYSLLNLIVVLATIYILIKVLKLDKLDKPKT